MSDVNTAPLPLEINEPAFLFAVGDSERIQVLRSPLVRDTDDLYQPVQRFIADHGLVLAAQETFPDVDWMWGQVEASMYVRPSEHCEEQVLELRMP